MNKNRKNQNFDLEKVINFLEEKNENKTIAIVGKINNKKTKLINSLYQYLSQDETRTVNNNTSFLNDVLELSQKKNANLSDHFKVQYINNKGVYSVNNETIVKTLSDSLKTNLENWINTKHNSLIRKIKKIKINRIIKKINNLEKYNVKIHSSNKMKMLFPILTTITTIGTSIGTPILSIALLRHKEIIDTFGTNGYYFLVAFCTVAIFFGIVSVIFYLATSIITSRHELLANNLIDGYKKLLVKHFLLPNQNKVNTKKTRRKIPIQIFSNYYFNEMSVNDKNYWNIMDLLMIHNAIGNNVSITISIKEFYELKNIFNDSWGKSNNYFVFNVASYKNGHNKEKIIDFLLSRISNDFDYDFINLYKKHDMFKNYLDAFYEQSDNNLQIMNVLNTFKASNLKQIDKKKISKHIDYFVDLFFIYLIKSLDFYTYDLLMDSFTHNLTIPKDIESKYNLIKFKNFFTKNLIKFKENALLFKISNLKEDEIINQLEIEDNNSAKEILKEFLENNNFSKQSSKSDNEYYVNNSNEKLMIHKIKDIENIDNIFDLLSEIMNKASDKKISYLIINFGFEFILMQNSLNTFQIIAPSSLETKKIVLI